MKHALAAAAAAAVFIPSAGSAGVSNLTPNTFIVQQVVELTVPPDRAFRAFGRLPRWWNPEHSYSGKASKLHFVMKAGDCLCETLPRGGSIEHMRVALVQPGDRLVLSGALGPLLFQAVSGVMDVTFERTQRGTMVVMHYRVAGFAYSNAEKVAPLVDEVLGEQMQRYAAFAEGRAR